MYMFEWLTGPSAEQNRQNVKDLARHLNTLKRRKSSSFSPSPLQSKRRKKRKSSSSSPSSRSSSQSSSKRKAKKRTRKLEAKVDELHKILAGLPRHSAMKAMIQQELQAKTQTEADVLGKLAAMADSLKAQKDASEAQMAALKLEIKAKQEQGESVEKETKELKAVMVDQAKTDATITRIEKYGGLVASGLNKTGALAANVGTALKGATYGVGDVTKSLGVNALGAAYGVGTAAKTVGSTALDALYGLGNATKAVASNALGAAYGVGNAAKDVHTNKEVVGYYANGAKFAAKTGALGAAPFVVGHIVDVKKLVSDVKGAINADVGNMEARLIRDAPSIQERQAATSGLVATANQQKKVLKQNVADPQARNVEAKLTKAAVQAKIDLKTTKELGALPVSTPSDDARVVELLRKIKVTDPFSDYKALFTGFKLRSGDVKKQILAAAKACMAHLKSEIQKRRLQIRAAKVHPLNVDEFHAAEQELLRETTIEKKGGVKGMEERFKKLAALTEFVSNIPLYAVPTAPPVVSSAPLTPEELAVGPDQALQAAAVADEAARAARASVSKHSPVRELTVNAADAAGAALDAMELANATMGEAAAEARAAAAEGMDAAAAAAAESAAAAEAKALKRKKSAARELKKLEIVGVRTRSKAVKFQ